MQLLQNFRNSKENEKIDSTTREFEESSCGKIVVLDYKVNDFWFIERLDNKNFNVQSIKKLDSLL